MFEQSILAENGTNKKWSFLASLGAELMVVSVMILIPLLYGDHLPGFHWKSVTVGPPIRSLPQQPVRREITSNSAHPMLMPASHPFIYPTQPARPGRPVESDAGPMDVPPGIQIAAGDGTTGGTGPMLFQQAVVNRPPAPPPPRRDPPHAAPVPVSGGVQMAKLIRQVVPVYPQLARTARIAGVVHLIGVIAKDGTIRNLQVIDGHPLLTRAALDAVSQWVYKPTLLSGEPVEVICPIDVVFKLGQ
jgi:periplasmic protein TonB